LKIGVRAENDTRKSLEFVLAPYSKTELEITQALAQELSVLNK
jgi:hypothetical protein